MTLAPFPPEELLFNSTLTSLFSGPSPSALRRLLPFLLPVSLLFYLFLYPGFTYSTPNKTPVLFSIFSWLLILPNTITFNLYVTLPFLVDQNVLQPSPSQEWFEARTLCSMAECLGFALGGNFVLLGCFTDDEDSVWAKIWLSLIAVSTSALLFGSESLMRHLLLLSRLLSLCDTPALLTCPSVFCRSSMLYLQPSNAGSPGNPWS